MVGPPSADAAAFGRPAVIAQGIAVSDPVVGVDASGRLYVAWNADGVINVRERPHGGKWQATRALGTGTGAPRLAVNSAGQASVAWNTDPTHIKLAARFAGQWSQADSIALPLPPPDLAVPGRPLLWAAGPAGDVYSTFQAYDEGFNYELISAAWRPFGGTFSAPVVVLGLYWVRNVTVATDGMIAADVMEGHDPYWHQVFPAAPGAWSEPAGGFYAGWGVDECERLAASANGGADAYAMIDPEEPEPLLYGTRLAGDAQWTSEPWTKNGLPCPNSLAVDDSADVVQGFALWGTTGRVAAVLQREDGSWITGDVPLPLSAPSRVADDVQVALSASGSALVAWRSTALNGSDVAVVAAGRPSHGDWSASSAVGRSVKPGKAPGRLAVAVSGIDGVIAYAAPRRGLVKVFAARVLVR
jgi:hypothetical protein